MNRSPGALARSVVAHLRRLVQLELALGRELLREGIRPLARSAGLALGAIVFGFLGLVCAVGAAVAALALAVPLWLSFVLVMLGLFLVSIGLAAWAARAYKEGAVQLSSALGELKGEAAWRPEQIP